MTRCCGDSRPVCRRSGGSVLAETSVTIQLRDRTLTICPCSGGEGAAMLISRSPIGRGPARRQRSVGMLAWSAPME